MSGSTTPMSDPSGEYAICVATFYEDLATRLVNGATEAFVEAGVGAASIHTFEVPGADGTIAHAEMRFGAGALMLDSGPRDERIWNENTQAVHVYLTDPDAHYARAQAAGARIVQPLHDTPWARAYYARDLEGFLWGFSTYKPA